MAVAPYLNVIQGAKAPPPPGSAWRLAGVTSRSRDTTKGEAHTVLAAGPNVQALPTRAFADYLVTSFKESNPASL